MPAEATLSGTLVSTKLVMRGQVTSLAQLQYPIAASNLVPTAHGTYWETAAVHLKKPVQPYSVSGKIPSVVRETRLQKQAASRKAQGSAGTAGAGDGGGGGGGGGVGAVEALAGGHGAHLAFSGKSQCSVSVLKTSRVLVLRGLRGHVL